MLPNITKILDDITDNIPCQNAIKTMLNPLGWRQHPENALLVLSTGIGSQQAGSFDTCMKFGGTYCGSLNAGAGFSPIQSYSGCCIPRACAQNETVASSVGKVFCHPAAFITKELGLEIFPVPNTIICGAFESNLSVGGGLFLAFCILLMILIAIVSIPKYYARVYQKKPEHKRSRSQSRN